MRFSFYIYLAAFFLCFGYNPTASFAQKEEKTSKSNPDLPRGAKAFERIRLNPDKEFRLQKAFQYYDAKYYEQANTLLEDLIAVYRGKPEAEKIFFYYAYTHFYIKNFTFANYYFKQFYSTYPTSLYAEEALYMSGESSFQLSPIYEQTQEDTYTALEALQLFVNTYPNSERVEMANKKMDILRSSLETKDYENAKGYLRRKQYKAAIHTFNAILVDYPETKNLEAIRYMIFEAHSLYAKNSILEKQLERYEEAKSHYDFFMKKHPNSEYKKQAEALLVSNEKNIAKIKTKLNKAK